MNRLLSFNPEPFETDFELRGARRGYDLSNDDWGQEAEFSSRLGRGRAPRSTSASGRPRRASTRTSGSFSTGEPRPSAIARRPPSYRRRSRPGWLGTFPFVGAERPLFPITEGEPGVGASLEPEPLGLVSEHVRWVQTCLNQIIGLRLATDGIMNAETRSAIRSFQERRGMHIDGLVGPETERALADSCKETNLPPPVAATPGNGPATDARAGELPGGLGPEWEFETVARRRRRATARPGVSPIATPAGPAPFDSSGFRQRIVRIANQELARWGNGSIKETDPQVRQTLQDYWRSGAGVNYSDAQLGDPNFQNDHPWSAAFISWVMKTAGAGSAFKYSSAHSTYTRWAKDNRLGNSANPFKAYRISELAPQVGDIVCKRRAGSGATYENIRPGMKTHCDIVTDVRPGRLVTIGGNVSNSVSQTAPRTDAGGFLSDPNYFAVIRIGDSQPIIPVVPVPTSPSPRTASVPRLVKQESMPPGTTLYVEIDLQIVDKLKIAAPPITGIFIPDKYVPGAAADLVLYLHGFKAEAIRRQGIDQYWNSQRFPYGALREAINASGRNVILVAPTLGSRSEAGRLIATPGLDAYIEQVLGALRAYGTYPQPGSAPALGNLILACHSGGGLPMRRLAGGRGRVLANIRECWGFDCTYNKGDDVFWEGWARAHPNAKVYIYFIPGSPTAPLADGLRDRRVPNAIVQPSRDKRHNYVPIAHWQERLQGASFLGVRSGGAVQPPRGAPGPAAPADVRRRTKTQFIEFVGENARRAMLATGVPASVTVAQAILETGWGKHTVGEAKNLFGIKGRGPAGSVRAPTREYRNGKWVTVDADFAKYENFEQSIADHAQFFLRNRRYARALQFKGDPDTFAREIHKAGYATAPDYATKLIELMRQYDLYRFDR
jgi:peptidoglycan hydrolase-like protein with peptidoglycan-binding domain